jgi:hypothetical protein
MEFLVGTGAKFEITVTRKVSVTVFGDAGGGSARFDYQVGGALGFRVAQKWTLQAGYRYMGVDYGSPSNFLFDVAQSGVVFGATGLPNNPVVSWVPGPSRENFLPWPEPANRKLCHLNPFEFFDHTGRDCISDI